MPTQSNVKTNEEPDIQAWLTTLGQAKQKAAIALIGDCPQNGSIKDCLERIFASPDPFQGAVLYSPEQRGNGHTPFPASVGGRGCVVKAVDNEADLVSLMEHLRRTDSWKTAVVIVNGSSRLRGQTMKHLDRNTPAIVIAGSGGFADRFADECTTGRHQCLRDFIHLASIEDPASLSAGLQRFEVMSAH